MGLFSRLSKRKYSYDEICDIVLPVADECHVDRVMIMPPKSRFKRDVWKYVDIMYYPGPGFTIDDEKRMNSLFREFPIGQFSIYKVPNPVYRCDGWSLSCSVQALVP